MIKKLFARLVGFREQRANFPATRFESEQKDEAGLARERHEEVMRSREKKYVSERTVPAEDEILGPSDSALRGEKKETPE